MAVTQPTGAIRSLVFGTITDVAFSPDGSKLYAERADGITAYDVASGSEVGRWSFGTKLGGIDISADGKFLVTTEQQPGNRVGDLSDTRTDYFLYRLDTGSAAVETHTISLQGYYTYPFSDAAFLSDGRVLLSNSGGWTPLTTYDFGSRTSTSTQLTFANSSTITATPDHQTFAVLPTNISDAPVYIYKAGTGITATHGGYADNVSGFNSGSQAISPDGGIVVQGVELNVYDGNLDYRFSLLGRYPFLTQVTGMAFSPSGRSLYLLDGGGRQILELDSATWDVIRGFPVQADTLMYPSIYGNVLQVSGDGKYLSVMADGVVQVITLGIVQSDTGTNGNDRLTGDDQQNVLYGFAGDDTLDGASGYDRLYGGAGNDLYLVDNASDSVIERPGEGDDTISSSVSFSLPSDVETLILRGEAGYGQGNGASNRLVGNDGPNSLTDDFGNDTLIGGGGNDVLTSGADNDRLEGGDGNDALTGGSGSDTLLGGAGNDIFAGTRANFQGDHILDLAAGDRIQLYNADPGTFAYSRTGAALDLGNGSILDIAGANVRFAVSDEFNGSATLVATTRYSGITDFDGDGHSDLLWRNSVGSVSTWRVSGNVRGDVVRESAYNNYVSPDWTIVETADFNGDARSDILWRHAGGTFSIWYGAAGGGLIPNSYTDGSVGTAWQIAATGDLNGDGRDDILWRNADGAISSWNSNGSGFQQNSFYHNSVGTNWKVGGVADFNGDGRADILWRNDGGAVSTWLGNGSDFTENSFYFDGFRSNWKVAGLADFSGDGRADILWRNDNGTIALWRADGTGFIRDAYTDASVGNEWQIAAVGDFDDDGRADIVWRNANGAISTWESNGSGFDKGVVNSWAPTDWAIVAHDYPG